MGGWCEMQGLQHGWLCQEQDGSRTENDIIVIPVPARHMLESTATSSLLIPIHSLPPLACPSPYLLSPL